MARLSLSGVAYTVQTGISAAGTTQGTATTLVADVTKVATVASGAGVVLPASVVGRSMTIFNKGANALLVYPPVSSTIDALASNAAFSIAAGAAQKFYCDTTATWYTLVGASASASNIAGGSANALLYQTAADTTGFIASGNYSILTTGILGVPTLTTVLPRGIQRYSVPAISAAGTTQGTATNLTGDISQVTTVAAGTGVQLPATVAGKIFRVANKGANALLVYPPTSSAIDALGTNVGFSLAVGAVQEFLAVTNTLWYSLIPAGGGGTTTNALTMNNGGAGNVSGSTFNGSAARTLSYNSIGAAPLAAPTFTGVPAAPTAAAGTDTTQLATTAFVRTAVKQIPFTQQNTAYALVAGDAGRGVKKTDTTARTYTVNNAVFAADDVVTLGNYSSTANITVASGAGFTMYLAGTTTTGSRTIAPRGVSTIVFESASVGYISGPGVT